MQAFVLRLWYTIFGIGLLLFLIAPLTSLVERVLIEVQERVNRTTIESPIDRSLEVPLPYTIEEVPISPSTERLRTISSGLRHACVVTSLSAVLCWGDNALGQLGIGIAGSIDPVRFTASPVVGLTDVTSVSLGAVHSCALRRIDGDVWCWGDNQYRQLGIAQNGPQTARTIASPVNALPPIAQLVSGAHHICALTRTSEVWCWGDNQYAQTGAPIGVRTSPPRKVDGLPVDVNAVYVGADHTCVSTVAGDIWCWGRNHAQQIDDSSDDVVIVPRQMLLESASLQVGLAQNSSCVILESLQLRCRGDTQPAPDVPANSQLVSAALGQHCLVSDTYILSCWDALTPASPSSLLGVAMVSSGDGFQCVLLRAGLVQCRGTNQHGQIGLPLDTLSVNDYVFVAMGTSRQFMSAGYAHVCTIWQLGKLLCWGRNFEGQLGLSSQAGALVRALPHEVSLNGVVDVVVAGNHSCVIRFDRRVNCWGNNAFGQLGLNDAISRDLPTLLPELVNVKQLALGLNHSCALLQDGRVACWGDNRFGQTASNVRQSALPIFVTQLQGVVKIAAGGNTSCALQNDGKVLCWGTEIGGQTAFVPIEALQDVVTVSVGFAHACAVQISGAVACWGDYRADGTQYPPQQIIQLPKARSVVVGGQHTCTLDIQQNVWCWGDNRQGQVNGEPSVQPILIPEQQARGVSHVVTGQDFTCVRKQVGTTACWGANRYAQLGIEDANMHYFALSTVSDGFVLAAGGNHSCVLLSGAAMRCWGGNEYGQLGDATSNSSPVPQTVRSTESFVSVEAGLAHTCAIVSDATVRCWGHNNFGQLGDETTENANAPVVSAVQDVSKLALGNSHTCAILGDGGAACWGRNEDGQLGVGGTANSAMPLRVADITDAVDIASGADHVCVVRQEGTVWCWGSNKYGQLGFGEAGPGVSIPTQVPGLTNVVALGLGDAHSCALNADGTVWCWGWNNYGQVGAMQIDEKSIVARPQQIAGVNDVMQIRVGGNHNCVLTSDAAAFCWGDNFNGQLGNPSLNDSVRSVPVPVAGIARFVSMAAGGAHSCGLLQNGDIECWGWNRYGQVGNGSGGFVTEIALPMPVVGLEGIESLAVGVNHLCASDTSGVVNCWGDNAAGQLGMGVFGDTAALAVPRKVSLATAGVATSVGVEHSCALLSSNELSCWGRNEFGQIGNGFAGDISDTAIPNFVTNFIGVTDFASGGNSTCAVLAGDVYCWGDNQYSQIGQPTSGIGDFRVQPTKIDLLADMRSVVVGKHHACALSNTSFVYCWGRNNQAQLGGFVGELSAVPQVVPNLADVVQLSAGDDHTCAVTAQGGVACWGSNSGGQLGIDSVPNAGVTPLPEFDDVRLVATGSAHTCVSNGLSVICWGSNSHGQLGIGSVTAEQGLASNRELVQRLPEVKAIVAGGNHSCALASQKGEVWCWGQNSNAQLGVTTNPDVNAPVAVINLWSMQVNQTRALTRTPLPTARMPKATATVMPTAPVAPTATLIRPRIP